MPLQNRVDPFGRLFRTAARGTIMGNRGPALHNERREIVRAYKGLRWIACVLEFKGRQRTVMTPRLYTELFFLDEAVALAAGHRPCAECRRERYNAFRGAWPGGDASLRAPQMDAVLHPARIDGRGRKVTYEAELESLPNGCFVAIDGAPWLVWEEALRLWTPERYTSRAAREPRSVTVLTPRPMVECLHNGYVPQVHESAYHQSG